MKKILISLSLFMSALTLSAQSKVGTVSLIPKIGVSLSNLVNNDLIYGNVTAEATRQATRQAGFAGGLEAAYQVTDQVAVSLAAMYSQAGCRYKDYEAVVDEGNHVGVSGWRYRLQYIQVPVMFNVYVAPGLAVKAGVQPGFLLDANYAIKEQPIAVSKTGEKTYGTITRTEDDKKDVYHSFDFSVPVGVSYEYMNVVLDARYNFGVTHVFKQGGNCRNSIIDVTVGYKFDL